jgi:hypothetical protein
MKCPLAKVLKGHCPRAMKPWSKIRKNNFLYVNLPSGRGGTGGRRYWAMLIGGSSRASTRRAGVTRVRVTRKGHSHDDEFGRDMTIDPYR